MADSPCPDHSFSRSSNFCTLPVEVLGSSSTMSTVFGALYRAILDFTWSISSCGCAEAPCLSTTNAFGTSPHFSSGTPTTAASSTASCDTTACSTSTVEMFSPPEMTTSLARSRSST